MASHKKKEVNSLERHSMSCSPSCRTRHQVYPYNDSSHFPYEHPRRLIICTPFQRSKLRLRDMRRHPRHTAGHGQTPNSAPKIRHRGASA